MLNQEKTGKYIAEKRRQAGMTQKEFAQMLGRSDKAVSKWETGKSLPDSSIMEDLCRILKISLNEFLSGEDLEHESYPDRAEEHIKDLMKEHRRLKRNSKTTLVCITVGFMFILTGLYAFSLNIHALHDISGFIEFPSLLFLLGIVLVILVLSGTAADFFTIFPHCFKKRKTDAAQLRRFIRALKMVLVLNLLASFFIFAGHMVLLPVAGTENPLQVFSIYFIPVWYGLFCDLILVPFLFRLYNSLEDII